jgi:hypothetical protein
MTMARRKPIGESPLNEVIPLGRRDEPRRARAPEPEKATKERVTFQLPVETIERARKAVFWTTGATMAALMEGSPSVHLARLEKKRGEAFPIRSAALKTGRPVKEA